MTALDFVARKVNGIEVRLTRNIKARALDTHLAEPVVSFCFDDFPRSAVTEGARLLRERGFGGSRGSSNLPSTSSHRYCR